MRVYEIKKFGLDGLESAERPEPRVGPGQVLVAVKATSLNYRDYLTLIGDYNPRLRLPLIPLCDGAGEVVALGEGVSEFQVGDRVVANFAQGWRDGIPDANMLRTSLGGPLDGMLAEKRVFPEYGLVRIPDALSYEEAATLPCAALTAWSALRQAGTKAGDTVLALGTGGVSIFALQFAKMLGAKVIITSSSDEKLEKARVLGADHVINYKTKPNWSKEVRRITRMRGVDHVIEVGGAGTLEHSLKSATIYGTVSLIGILAGRAQELDLIPILMQNIRVQGVLVGSRSDLVDMNRAIEVNKLKPVVDKVFPFEEAREAFAYMEAGRHFGKICVRVSD